METLVGWIGATILGAGGWWLGDHLGMMSAFVMSMVGTGLGLYTGRRLAREYLS